MINSRFFTLGGSDFTPLKSLLVIDVVADNPDFCSVDGVLFNKDRTKLIKYPSGKQGDYTIPDGVAAIDHWAFGYCSGLTGLTLPASVNHHEITSFRDCGTELQRIEVAAGNTTYHSENGVLFSADRTRLIRYPGARKGGYTIPDGVIAIDAYACTTSPGLTAVTFPNSITTIGYYAFGNCVNLTSALFQGDAPTYDMMISNGTTAFAGSSPGFAVYFRSGAKGFTASEWQGHPAKEGEPPAPAPPMSWTSTDGKTVVAKFLKLDGESVVIEKEDGQQFTIPFARLSPASVEQAKKLGASTAPAAKE